jgi:hypothetical protein
VFSLTLALRYDYKLNAEEVGGALVRRRATHADKPAGEAEVLLRRGKLQGLDELRVYAHIAASSRAE